MSETGDPPPPVGDVDPPGQNSQNLADDPPNPVVRNQAAAGGAAALARRATNRAGSNGEVTYPINVVPEGSPIPVIQGVGNTNIPGPPNLYLDVPNNRLVWVGAPPDSDLERYLAEDNYLSHVASNAAEDAIKNVAAGLVIFRANNPSLLSQAIKNLTLQVTGEAQATGFENNPVFFDSIEPPLLGTVDVVPSEARKAVASIMGTKRFSGEERTFESFSNLELLLNTAVTYITNPDYSLSGKGAFALLRPFLTKFAAEQLSIYSSMGEENFPVFWNLIQAQSRSNVNREDAINQKNLLKSAPIASRQINDVLIKVIKLNKYIVEKTSDPKDFFKNYQKTSFDDLRDIVTRHYPSLSPTVFQSVNQKKLQAEAKVARLKSMGRFREAENAAFHELSALQEAITSLCQVASETNRLSFDPLPDIAGNNHGGGFRGNRRRGDFSQGPQSHFVSATYPGQPCYDNYGPPAQYPQQSLQDFYQYTPNNFVSAASHAQQTPHNFNQNRGGHPRQAQNQQLGRAPHFSNSQPGRYGPSQIKCFRCGNAHHANTCQKYPEFARYLCRRCGGRFYHREDCCQENGNTLSQEARPSQNWNQQEKRNRSQGPRHPQ